VRRAAIMEGGKQIFWLFFCLLGVVCLIIGLFCYNYVERRQLQGFHYYYYVNPYEEYASPLLFVGFSSLIIGTTLWLVTKTTKRIDINQPNSTITNAENREI
jgi:RsiW-degrading membrane proteinase PrsW (M82 family)